MGGIIAGALGGLGNGMQATGQALNASAMADQQLDGQKQLAQIQNDLAIQKEQAVLDMKSAAAQRERQNMADSIAAERQNVINGQVQQTYGDYDAALAGTPNSGTPLTPDQQAVIQQAAPMVANEKSADLAKLAADPHTYITAAMSKGYIDPSKVADLAQQEAQLRQTAELQDKRLEAESDLEDQREAHTSSENAKNRAMEQKRLDAMYGNSASVSDDEKRNWVHTYVVSNGTVPRSAPVWVRNNIGTWAAQMGISPDDIAAGTAKNKFDQAAANTAGHRSGTMAGVEAALPALADNAVDLSQKVGNGKFVPLNKLMMLADDSISDPNLAAFKAANQALASEYQQVISRGGTNVTALKEAMEVLNRAASPEAYAAAVNQVKREVNINVAAMNNVRNNMGGSHGGTGGPQLVPNPIAPPTGGVLTYDPKTGTFH